MNNNYVKFDCGRFYEVTTVNSDLYNDFNEVEREKCVPLTEEEVNVTNEILGSNSITTRESLALTKSVFGKSAFFYL